MTRRWPRQDAEQLRATLRRSLLGYTPDPSRVADLIRYYFVGPVSDEQIATVDEMLRQEWPHDAAGSRSAYRAPVGYPGLAWFEEFGHGADDLTASDFVLLCADGLASQSQSKPEKYPPPELYCPARYVGTWEQQEPEPKISEPVLWIFHPDGRFETNNPEIEPTNRLWSINSRGMRNLISLEIREQRYDTVGAYSYRQVKLHDDELTFERRRFVSRDDWKFRLVRRAGGPSPFPRRPITTSGTPFHWFTYYVVNPRSLAEAIPHFENTFNLDLLPTADPDSFESSTLGIDLRITRVAQEPTGDIWRLDGDTVFTCPGMITRSVHIRLVELLRQVGFTEIYNPAMYAERANAARTEPAAPRVVVRSAEEAGLYMAQHHCPVCGDTEFEQHSRIVDVGGTLVSIYEGDCDRCMLIRRFELALDDAMPPMHTEDAIVLGEGTSRALDAGQLTDAATRITSTLPVAGAVLDAEACDRAIYQARLAIGALDEAQKLAPSTENTALRADLVQRLTRLRATARDLRPAPVIDPDPEIYPPDAVYVEVPAKVSVKTLEELGWAWPPHPRVAADSIESVDPEGMVDLYAVAVRMANYRDYCRSELEGNREFARKWGARLDEVTDRTDELREGVIEYDRALDAVNRIIRALSVDPPRRRGPATKS